MCYKMMGLTQDWDVGLLDRLDYCGKWILYKPSEACDALFSTDDAGSNKGHNTMHMTTGYNSYECGTKPPS